MSAKREDVFEPAWSGDRLDSGYAPETEAAYFVAGIGFKRNGKLILTPERPLRPLSEIAQGVSHRRFRCV